MKAPPRREDEPPRSRGDAFRRANGYIADTAPRGELPAPAANVTPTTCPFSGNLPVKTLKTRDRLRNGWLSREGGLLSGGGGRQGGVKFNGSS